MGNVDNSHLPPVKQSIGEFENLSKNEQKPQASQKAAGELSKEKAGQAQPESKPQAKQVKPEAKPQAEQAKQDPEQTKREAKQARQEADQAKREAEQAKKESEQAKKESEQAKKEAEQAKQRDPAKAKEAEKKAEEAEKKSKEADKKAEQADKKSEQANKKAEQAEKKAEQQEQEEEEGSEGGFSGEKPLNRAIGKDPAKTDPLKYDALESNVYWKLNPDSGPAPIMTGPNADNSPPNSVKISDKHFFIHFSYCHPAKVQQFPHPKYPNDDAGGAKSATPQEPKKSTGEQAASVGAKLQKKREEEAEVGPETQNIKKFAKEEDFTSDEEVKGPAGQAILMRDALVRESALLHGFVSSALGVHKDWTENRNLVRLLVALGPAALLNPAIKKLANWQAGSGAETKLKDTRTAVAEIANSINKASVDNEVIRTKGMDLHEQRIAFRKICQAPIGEHFLNKKQGIWGALHTALDMIGWMVPFGGPLIRSMLGFTLNGKDVFYAIYLEMRDSFEPVIECTCDEFSDEVIRIKQDPTFDIWYHKETEDADPAGKKHLDKIFEVFLKGGKKAAFWQMTTEEDDIRSAYDVVTESITYALGLRVVSRWKKGQQTHEQRYANTSAWPVLQWARLWTLVSVKSLKVIYDKLLAQSEADRVKAIDKAFVLQALKDSGTGQFADYLNKTYAVIKTGLSALKSLNAGAAREQKQERDERNQKLKEQQESAKIWKKAMDSDKAPSGDQPDPGAVSATDATTGDLVNPSKQATEAAALEAVGKMTPEQKATLKKDIAEIESKKEEKEPVNTEDQIFKVIDKAVATFNTSIDNSAEKIAKKLEDARTDAAAVGALTFEAYLGRLPWLMAELVHDTAFVSWQIFAREFIPPVVSIFFPDSEADKTIKSAMKIYKIIVGAKDTGEFGHKEGKTGDGLATAGKVIETHKKGMDLVSKAFERKEADDPGALDFKRIEQCEGVVVKPTA